MCLGSSRFREVIELGFGVGGTSLGIGTTITIGAETAKYGITAIVDSSRCSFDIDVDLSTMQLCTDVQIPQLTLGDIASLYDDITGSGVYYDLPGSVSQWGIQSLTFALADLYISFCFYSLSFLLSSGTFNGIQCTPGFTLDASANLFGVWYHVDCT